MINKFSSLIQIIFLATGVMCWQFLFPFIEAVDTHFVMNIGRYVLEHGIPYVDPFTIHENITLVAQQWLSGVFFWEAYKNFGINGLIFIDCAVATLSAIIYWRLCLFVSDGQKILSFVMAFLVSMAITVMIVPRPHIFSALIFVTEIFLLEKFTRTGEGKFLLPLPLLSILLINCHAAVWMISLVLCLPFLFVKDNRHIKFLVATMFAMFLCGFVNPYGIDAMTYVLRSYGIGLINERIPEMFSPTAHDFSGKIFFLTEIILVVVLTKVKVPLRYIFLCGGITFMALMHVRNIMLFYLIATFPIAYALKDLDSKKFLSKTLPLMIAFLLVLAVNTIMVTMILSDGLGKLSAPLLVLFTVVALVIIYNLFIVRSEGRILHPTILSQKILWLFATALVTTILAFSTTYQNKQPDTYSKAIEFILRTERPEDVRLYVTQGIGGLAGSYGIRYYIDSRSEVFLPVNNAAHKNIFAEYLKFTSGEIYYRDFFSRYDFTHIIVTSDDSFIFDELSHDKDFRVIYESERVDGSKVTRCKIFVPKVGD